MRDLDRRIAILAVALAAAAMTRVVLLSYAPRYGFFGDHVDYVCWGRQAVAEGILSLYRKAPGLCSADFHGADGMVQMLQSGGQQRLNYPPLAAYVFWIQGRLLAALDPAQTANTLGARTVYALGTTVGELVTALGAAALLRGFRGPTAVAAAFGLVLIAPPLLLDGPFWGQTEAWVLAPATWMLWAMVHQRWLLAGALWGLALALKPSGLIFAPLWAYAFLFRPARQRIVLAGLVAVLVLNLAAMPFWLTSGAEWLRTTYLANYVYELRWTTMMTFNVWYADLLVHGKLDARTPLLGVSRDAWGAVLLAGGLVLSFALTRRWEHRHPARAHLGVVPLAALVTLAAVMLPTRVHSTYTAFSAPFLICTAFLAPRTIPGAAVMLVAASLQILSWQWGNLLAVHVMPDERAFWGPERYAERQALRARDRPREWALTLLSLGATAAVFAGVAGAAPDRRAPAGRQHGWRKEDESS